MRNDYALEPIALGDGLRLAIWYDTWAENPLEWDEDISCHVLKQSQRYQTYETSDTLSHNLNAIVENVPEDDWQPALDKLFTRQKRAYKIVTFMSYRDWIGDYVLYGESEEVTEDILDSMAHTLKQYYNGEVYVFGLEKLVSYAEIGNDDNTHEHWELQESVGGYYIDDYSEDNLIGEAIVQFGLEIAQ